MPQIVKKPASILELGQIDITELKNKVESLSENVWALEDARKENKFKGFHHTQHINFRFIRGNRNHRDYYSEPIWFIWKRLLLPIMNQAVAPYAYSQPIYPKVMLARLAAGYSIDHHSDGAGSNSCVHKIHIPIQTNTNATFIIDGVKFHLQEGHAYEVNNLALHAAQNAGEDPRIHLIFELYNEQSQSVEGTS